MDQEPCKLGIMPVTGIVRHIAFMTLIGEPVPAPDNVEFDLGRNCPVFEKLWYSGFILRMNDTIEKDVNNLQQFSSMYILTCVYLPASMLPWLIIAIMSV